MFYIYTGARKKLFFLDTKKNVQQISFEDFSFTEKYKKYSVHIPFVLLIPGFIIFH